MGRLKMHHGEREREKERTINGRRLERNQPSQAVKTRPDNLKSKKKKKVNDRGTASKEIKCGTNKVNLDKDRGRGEREKERRRTPDRSFQRPREETQRRDRQATKKKRKRKGPNKPRESDSLARSYRTSLRAVLPCLRGGVNSLAES